MQAGYYCSVCECVLRDSQSYLDHINGKYHNRALGMNMVVERSTADQVRYATAYRHLCPSALAVSGKGATIGIRTRCGRSWMRSRSKRSNMSRMWM